MISTVDTSLELIVILTHRFERLRGIIQLRNQRIKEMEQQAVYFFEKGQLQEIELLMQQKEGILSTNKQLSLFIKKWEQKSNRKEEQLYTSV